MAQAPPLLAADGLHVTFNPPTGPVAAVRGVGLQVARGEILGIVGESGSGKSVTCRSILGLTPSSATLSGTICIDGESGSPQEMAGAVRSVSAMVYQNPGAALNPVFTIGRQLQLASKDGEDEELIGLLERVGLADPERAMKAYPHEFSGGMQQRAAIAMALAQKPELLVADEPTTALDVTTEVQILDLLSELRDEQGLSVVFISHDLGVIARLADRVSVMTEGKVVESGATAEVLSNPKHEYTQHLIAASASGQDRPHVNKRSQSGILEIEGLTVDYRDRDGARGAMVRVIDDLSMSIQEGETVALVGESGSGKSTLANAVAGLVNPASGTIRFNGTELTSLGRKARNAIRSQIQMVFQNPLLSLSPRRSIRWQLHEPLRLHTNLSAGERNDRIAAMVAQLDLDLELLDRRPHELSGGQAQRVVLARALLLEPTCIVFDEPTSALDVSVQAEVLDLIQNLQAERQLTYLFITHDLAVARHLSDRIAVMRSGEIVEMGKTQSIFANPQHSYTRALLKSSASISGDFS